MPAHGPRAAVAALLCTFTVTGHSSAPALTGLPVAGVLLAPAAVLTQGHPVGVVALALVGLVVAMLTLLAGEGDSDSNVSASHDQKSLRRCGQRPWAKKNPAQARGAASLACLARTPSRDRTVRRPARHARLA